MANTTGDNSNRNVTKTTYPSVGCKSPLGKTLDVAAVDQPLGITLRQVPLLERARGQHEDGLLERVVLGGEAVAEVAQHLNNFLGKGSTKLFSGS